MSDALKAATEDLRLLCDLYENGSPITMSAAQFVAESGRTILAALDAAGQAVAAEREACAKLADDFDASGADGYDIPTWGEGVAEGAAHAASGIAAAIRARGKEAGDA